MDGAGNMSGKNIGCAAKFRELSPRALYHYCSSHNLNLVLCKSCQVTEINLMLDSLKQLGIFFKYSSKRSRKLEKATEDINENRADNDKITKSKFKVFCETRWTEKHTTLDSFVVMYEAIVLCLESISSNEGRSWDRKAIIDATGLLTKITDSTFIMSFQTIHNFFGYLSGLSKKLQGSSLDIVAGYTMIASVKDVIESTRTDENEYNVVYEKANEMADKAGIGSLSLPRRCSKQRNRNNVPASTPKEYFKRAIYLPFLDATIQQLNIRFGEQTKSVIRALSLLPSNVNETTEDVENDVFQYYKEDLPTPDSFRQELRLWKSLWIRQVQKPDTITSTITDSRSCSTIFPNITMILNLLSLTSVTSSSTERANSSLKLIKTAMRSTMGEDRLNTLMLLYVHRDIEPGYDKIIDEYASQNPRKMVLSNPLA